MNSKTHRVVRLNVPYLSIFAVQILDNLGGRPMWHTVEEHESEDKAKARKDELSARYTGDWTVVE